jgi:ATP-binding cassette subfamily F protein uup
VNAPPPPAAAAPSAPSQKARKLSFKEQRELEGLPELIAALEAEQKEINLLLADGSLYAIDNARAMKLAQRSAEIDDALMTALERWEALGTSG